MYLTSFPLCSKGRICEGSDMRGSDMRGSTVLYKTTLQMSSLLQHSPNWAENPTVKSTHWRQSQITTNCCLLDVSYGKHGFKVSLDTYSTDYILWKNRTRMPCLVWQSRCLGKSSNRIIPFQPFFSDGHRSKEYLDLISCFPFAG